MRDMRGRWREEGEEERGRGAEGDERGEGGEGGGEIRGDERKRRRMI